jgi:hypothetical protein
MLNPLTDEEKRAVVLGAIEEVNDATAQIMARRYQEALAARPTSKAARLQAIDSRLAEMLGGNAIKSNNLFARPTLGPTAQKALSKIYNEKRSIELEED